MYFKIKFQKKIIAINIHIKYTFLLNVLRYEMYFKIKILIYIYVRVYIYIHKIYFHISIKKNYCNKYLIFI